YLVTVTRAGQLNFRYMTGGQVFDSNPEAAVPDMASSRDAASWSDSNSDTNAAYTVSALATPDQSVPGATSSYFLNTSDPLNAYDSSQAVSTPEPNRMQAQGASGS